MHIAIKHLFIFYYFVLGLTKKTSDEVTFSHVTAMADFAFRLKDALKEVNEHSFNNFKLRAGWYYFFLSNALRHYFLLLSMID